jgi:hypothetical protein
MNLQPVTLWSNTSRTRFFLISDEQPLPLGDLVLRTITGGEQRVDPTAVAAFEVTEEQAKEWVKGEFGKILDNARGAVNRFLERLRSGPENPDRIAGLRELLDRVEAIVELIVTESPDGERAADIESLVGQLDRIEARLQQLAQGFRAANLAPNLTDPSGHA